MDAQQFLLMRLESGNLSNIKNALKTFIEANSDSFTFPTLDRDKLDKLYSLVFNILCNPMYSECYIDCLSCLKLLFRDSKYLDELISQERFNILLQTARLYNTQPTVCYSDLTISFASSQPSSLEQLGSGAGEGESHNADALLTIITYLHEELASRVPSPGTTPTSSSGTVDHILPVLHVLSEAARHHKALRRLIRNQILPARRDFSSRPEEGDSLLSHLTRCLSSGNTMLRDCCADLLFVLCKENPARLIKYTGYGNAAGMLAARGLLGCQNKGQYSSSSEESDTEEYLRVKDNINPVTGVYEPPKPDSTQGKSNNLSFYPCM
ncbi:synembryn [Diaphorina citri]|uniref:Synembryn n=1 Tax=Diaphorina citri TaxID=121845 RepID=A0A3Q0INL8_DIACI|nr:synembryn [Diaphorina citri]